MKRSSPLSRPYDKGYVNVGDGHRLYYERCGNRKGIPAVFLHGGPGAGFHDGHKELFDLRKYDVLFFDQRGAGRSKPFASIKANTTDKLVSDITLLLDRFGIRRAVFVGGSWGSTLALVYALQNINRVSALVLRGIFVADKASLCHYVGGGVRDFAPEVWDRFISRVPRAKRRNPLDFYYRKMTSTSPKVRRTFCYEWARFELSILALRTDEKAIEKMLSDYSYESLAILEAHYIKNKCFLPKDYILKNAAKLSRLPVSIVHGRYDLVCRPVEAYDLHKLIKGSKLRFVHAGHASSEPEIKHALLEEMKALAKRLK